MLSRSSGCSLRLPMTNVVDRSDSSSRSRHYRNLERYSTAPLPSANVPIARSRKLLPAPISESFDSATVVCFSFCSSFFGYERFGHGGPSSLKDSVNLINVEHYFSSSGLTRR